MPGMTDRDHFAAAALTGFASQPRFNCGSVLTLTAKQCYELADAMLRERARTNLDAAPAARAPEPEPEPAARRLPAGGTGDTVHGASPEARASVGRPRTDNADLPICAGTGDTPDSPQPIACSVFDRPQPIAKPTPVHTPPAHATPGEGSVPRDGTEPVAWGVANCKGLILDATTVTRVAVEKQSEYAFDTEIVPLYRSPTLTDAEREALERICEAADDIIDEDERANGVYWQDDAAAVAVVRGLLERMGGVR